MRRMWGFTLLAAGAVAALVLLLVDRDGPRIERRLGRLVETVEKKHGDGQLVTLARAQRIAGFFTPEAELRLQPIVRHPLSRDDLSRLLLQAHASVETLSIDILDRALDLRAGVAEMRLTGETSTASGGSQEVRGYKVVIDWIKQEREWYIDRAEIVEGIHPQRGAEDHGARR